MCLYAQLKSQVQQLDEAVKDRDGTIETLERQLVQAGIKNKVMQGDVQINKQTQDTKSNIFKEELETKAQQKHLRKSMQDIETMLEESADKKIKDLEKEVNTF